MKFINQIKENKKATMIVLIAIIALLLVVGGSTFAFFRAQTIQGTQSDIGLKSGTTDSLTFIQGDAIYINANLNNFAQGLANLTDETDASAQLIANDVTNEASEDYNVFFIIDTNDFDYTTEDNQAEIVLRVWDPNGNEITNITGLNYQNTDKDGNPLPDDEKGFDITTRTGGFLVSADYIIEASLADGETGTASTTQTWHFEVTLINLDVEQNDNKGKALNGRILMTTEQSPTYEITQVNSLIATTSTYNTIETLLQTTSGTEEVATYHYGIREEDATTAYIGERLLRLSNKLAVVDGVTFAESKLTTHIFKNLTRETEYKVYAYTTDKYGFKSDVYDTNVSTREYNVPIIDNVEVTTTLYTMTIKASATGHDGEVEGYYFSIDDGVSWQSSTNGEYTYTNLKDTSTYNIKVRAIDSNSEYSTDYETKGTTETYYVPTITKVDSTTTYQSITLTTSASKGTNEVLNYYYSIDGGKSYTTAQGATYTFNSLAENTKYNIMVKVEDTAGRYSVEYPIDVTTDAYNLPKVSNATTTTTSNAITVNATSTNGDGTVQTYYFSRNNGSNWYSSTTGSYTFNTLTSGVTYTISIKVMDNNNRESAVYTTTATTLTMSVTPTVASSTAGNNGWYKAVSISATTTNAESGSTIKYCTTTSTTCSPSTTYSSAVAIANNTTATRVCFNVTDKAGNVSATSCSGTYKVDGTASNPTIAINSSTTGSNSWYKAMSIKVTGTDAHSKTSTIKYCTTTSSTCTPSTAYSSAVTLSSNASAQKLCATETDNAGNTSGVVCGSAYSVDTSATTPTVAINTSTAGNNGWYKAMSIKVTGTDAHSGNSAIKYCTTTSSTCTPSTTYSSAVSLANNTTATRVCATITDRAGNVSSVACSSAYSVDNVVPTISSFTSTSVGTNSITVSVSASDTHSKIKTYYYSSNGGSSYVSSTSSTYTFSGLSSNTTYSLRTYVIDSAGNQSAVKSLSVTTKKSASELNGLVTTLNILANSNSGGSYTNGGYLYYVKDDTLYYTTDYKSPTSGTSTGITGVSAIATLNILANSNSGGSYTNGGYLYYVKDGTLYYTTDYKSPTSGTSTSITGVSAIATLNILANSNGSTYTNGGYLYYVKDDTLYYTTDYKSPTSGTSTGITGVN